MNGAPIDPVPYDEAVRELWVKLAASQGIDVRRRLLQRADSDDRHPDAHVDSWLQHLRDEAGMRILGMVTCSILRAWLSDREDWVRPTEAVLIERLFRVRDMPRLLTIDRHELEAVIASRWPELQGSRAPQGTPASAAQCSASKGRPKGSGAYTEADAPLLLHMRALLESRTALSVHAASMIVAEQARGGGTLESRARRLREGYKRMQAAKV